MSVFQAHGIHIKSEEVKRVVYPKIKLDIHVFPKATGVVIP